MPSSISDVVNFISPRSFKVNQVDVSPTIVIDESNDQIPMEDLGSVTLTNMKQKDYSTKAINKPHVLSPRIKARRSRQLNSSLGSMTNGRFGMLSPKGSILNA